MEISHVRRAYTKGLGNIDNIKIVGSKLEEVKRELKKDRNQDCLLKKLAEGK